MFFDYIVTVNCTATENPNSVFSLLNRYFCHKYWFKSYDITTNNDGTYQVYFELKTKRKRESVKRLLDILGYTYTCLSVKEQ